MAEDSDENSGKISEDSDNLNSQKDNSDAEEDSDSKGSSSFGIKKFFKARNLNDETVEGEKEPERKTESEAPKKPEAPETSEEHHDISFTPSLKGQSIFGSLGSHKTLIIQGVATVIGAVMIVYGTYLFTIPTIKVADNVIFGDESAFAVLLILLGVIVIISAFARKLFGGTFLHTIHKEIKAVEKKVSDDKSENEGNESKSNSLSDPVSGTKVQDPSSSTDDNVKDNNDESNKDIK